MESSITGVFKAFVKNVPKYFSQENLESILKFIPGYSGCILVLDKKKRSRCFGYVWLSGEYNYHKALAFKGLIYEDKIIEFQEVNKSNTGEKKNKRKVYISGINHIQDSNMLATIFSLYGAVEKASVKFSKDRGSNRGFGFVIFKHPQNAALAVLNSGSIKHKGKKLKCKFAISKSKMTTSDINCLDKSIQLNEGKESSSNSNISNKYLFENQNNNFNTLVIDTKRSNIENNNSTVKMCQDTIPLRDMECASRLYKQGISSYYNGCFKKLEEM